MPGQEVRATSCGGGDKQAIAESEFRFVFEMFLFSLSLT
jgi:hypothetical protein